MKKLSIAFVTAISLLSLSACNHALVPHVEKNTQNAETKSTNEKMRMESLKEMDIYKEKAVAVLDTLNTGDSEAVAYINPDKYVQHNLDVADGVAGFGAVLSSPPPQGFSAKTHRTFVDGEYVFLHTEYDFFGPKAGFDIFRFEEGLIVEHWDNLTAITPPNPSGRTQFDGTAVVIDIDKTESNKAIIRQFADEVLIAGNMENLATLINPTKYLQHNSSVADGLDGFGAAMKNMAENGLVMEYDRVHMLLGEGNFVLLVSEGKFGAGDHVAYYDLFRLENNQIVEHWDVIQTIPPRSDWKNNNSKF